MPSYHGAMVPSCHGAFVPWCHSALLPGALVSWFLGAWCHVSSVPWCLCAMVRWFHGAFVPWFDGAFVPCAHDVPPQPNSPPDNVFCPDRPAERALGPNRGAVPRSNSRNNRIPLVRTSSELDIRRTGKAPEGTIPSLSPVRHAKTCSRCESSLSSPLKADGFGTGTPVPSPQCQSFSRNYGSILPTSLAYIVPSTRGCYPWRPDVVMSMTKGGRHSVL
ncbi:hypothetical protein CQW23_08915 [Capsicum baccatum]|uniref:Protein TAR1 n=1 Tax=Capsicum baccatum TaxID=33114 RepID=A0A2G2XAE5_CAPBA|nr:hypothetical protein CQW23_08915 [Capsicum baccatum]